MPNASLFFAAGLGTRMQPLTNTMPKPLVHVAGRPLIDHALEPAREHGIETLVVNTHYLPETIHDHLAGQNILFSNETNQRLETGGGLRKALPMLGNGPVFTMNTDAVWSGGNPFATLDNAWKPDRMQALLLLTRPENARGHTGQGDFDMTQSGQLTRGRDFIYLGAQIIKPIGIHDVPLKSFSLNVLWDQMISKGTLFGVEFPGHWCDVGRPESIAIAETMLEHN